MTQAILSNRVPGQLMPVGARFYCNEGQPLNGTVTDHAIQGVAGAGSGALTGALLGYLVSALSDSPAKREKYVRRGAAAGAAVVGGASVLSREGSMPPWWGVLFWAVPLSMAAGVTAVVKLK